MKVITRSNLTENLCLDKILNRIKDLGNKNNLEVDYDSLGLKVINSIYDGVTTTELDEETARISATDIANPDNLKLASLIIIDNHHKNTNNSFVNKMRLFMENDIIEKEIWDIVENNQNFFNTNVDYSLDFIFDYFGFKTMEKSYLIRVDNKVVERPQDMIMREALGIHRDDLDAVLESYKLLSKGYFTHATPTLFHSCTKKPQHSSCFDGSTRVFTLNGTKRIDEVEIGDMVITHKNNIKKVVQLHKNKLGDRKLYVLKCHGKTDIKVTGNHRFWVSDQENKTPFSWVRLDELNPSVHIIKHRKLVRIERRLDKEDGETILVNPRYASDYVYIKRILEITEDLPEYVYTLGVEEDHSYSVEGLLVENCFLLASEDSVEGIYKTVADCAKISQYAGGIGLHLSMIRATGSKVKGTNGKSGGLPPMLKVLNETARHINQCFEGSTIVYTDKGSKKIEDIDVDDIVLTHDGTFNRVEKNHMNEVEKNILSIELTCSYPVKVTEEHVVCVLKNNSRKNKTKFLPASQLERDDYMMFPMPIVENIDYSLNNEQSFFLGLCFSNSTKISDESLIVNKIFKNGYDFILDFCNRKNIYPQVFDNYIKIDLSEFKLSRDMLIKESKKVLFEKVILSKNFIIKEFLSGYMSGTLKDFNNNNDSIYYNISFDTIENCENIKYLMLKLGYLCKSFKTKLCCGLIIPNWNSFEAFNNDISGDYFFENNAFFCKIKDIKKIPFTGKVYDLTVEENHTYTTSIGAVHNSGRRPGSFAVYLEPFHADIIEFLDMKKNDGKEEFRARDLFYAIWMPDLFMECVEQNKDWYLMCPSECPNLNDVYGDEFKELYYSYVERGMFREKISAQSLWKRILTSQIETGTPYICYKDSANKKSNQKNLGTIKSSNLCVAPETIILTKNGYFPIKSLENMEVKVWNGEEWSETTVRKTGTDQELLKVVLSNGSEIDCTPYHNFYIKSNGKYIKIEAQDLKEDMELIETKFPQIHMEDMCFNKEILDSFYEKGRNSIQVVDARDGSFLIDDTFNPRDTVALNKNYQLKIKYLEGLVNKSYEKKLYYATKIEIVDHNVKFLTEIKYLLNTLGCDGEIEFLRKSGYSKLTISNTYFNKLIDLGFRCNKLTLSIHPPIKNIVKVVGIEYTERISDTFCFTESKRGMGVFNGNLTGNCSEIIQYSSPEETSTCNLLSIALPKFVEFDKYNKPFINHNLLFNVAKMAVRNLNKLIDTGFYPIPEARRSNFKHRPLGIGVQGLAHMYMKFKIPYESLEAEKLNIEIFETIYYGCLTQSMELSKQKGPYETFVGSPLSEGFFQFDLWKEYNNTDLSNKISGRWDWELLRENIIRYGVRNSLLTTIMPTASTAQILSNSECCEPITSNMFSRRVLSGEFIVLNHYLVDDLKKLGLWDTSMKDLLLHFNGSVQEINRIPDDLKKIYKTVWEIPQKSLINQAADRGVFIDQSQSLNLFLESPSHKKLTNMHFYTWKKGLKTGIYYLRTKSASRSNQVTVDMEKIKKSQETIETTSSCPYIPGQAPPDCESCSG